MPHVEISCYPGRSEEQKKECAARITEAIVQTMGCSATSVSIAIKEVPQDQWKAAIWDTHIAPEADSLYKKPEYTCD